MRQATIVLSLAGSFMLYALTVNLFDTIFMFVLFGILPSRTEPLSADQMLAINGTATMIVLAFMSRGLFSLPRPLTQNRRQSAS
jgi:hypothetical protein